MYHSSNSNINHHSAFNPEVSPFAIIFVANYQYFLGLRSSQGVHRLICLC